MPCAQRRPDALPDDGGFADARVGDAQFAVLALQTRKALVHVADHAHVFADGEHTRVAAEHGIEAGPDDLPAIHERTGFGIHRLYFRHMNRRFRRLAVQM